MNSAATTTALARSRLTGRPVPSGSAVALPVSAALDATPRVPPPGPTELTRILRPQAAQRWILPQLSAITPTYIEGVLRGAFSGSHIQQWELFDLMEDTWPRLLKNLGEIKRAVLAMDWKIEPWSEEDQPPTESARERARLVSSALWRMQPDPALDENAFEGTLRDILDAWAKGVSVLEILWHTRRAGPLGEITAPRATIWARPDCYAWASDGRLGLNPNALEAPRHRARGYLASPAYLAHPEDVLDFPAEKFLVAIHKSKTGHPLGGALLRPLAWWWCAANFSADWLMNLAQIFGLPFRWANYASGASEQTVTAIGSMLENMGSAGWAAFPEGTTLELKEAGNLGSQSPQADLIERADKNCDLLLLGQTLTSDSGGMGQGGGSLALGKVHEGVKGEVVQAAANFAAEILNRQFVPAILRLNYGDEEEAPEFCPEPERQEDQKANAERDNVLINAGVEMPKEWFYRRHNIPLPQDGEDVIARSVAAPGPDDYRQPESGQDGRDQVQPFAARLGSPPPRGNGSLSRLARAFAEDLQPLRERLARIMEIQDEQILRAKLTAFVAELPQLLSDINADPESARVLEDEMRSGLIRAIKRT